MKNLIILLSIMTAAVLLAMGRSSASAAASTTQAGLTATAFADTVKSDPPTRREEREQARREKQAAYEKLVDSLVMTTNFSFLPLDFSLQPAGRLRQIANPNFKVIIYPDYADICLPYYRGITPPYVMTVLNYTVSNMEYVAKKKDNTWTFTFKTSLYSANNYTFTFTIEATTGEVNLDIKSDFLNTVSYSGSIMPNN